MLHPSAYLEFRQWHQEKLGRAPSALRLLGHWLRQWLGKPPIAPVKLAGLRHPVYLRPWSSDLYVFEQIFIDHEYDTPLQRPATILDAGAKIGLAAGGRWLEQAQSIVVECHDRLLPGCEATVLQAASQQKLTLRRSGEYLVLQRPAAGLVRHE